MPLWQLNQFFSLPELCCSDAVAVPRNSESKKVVKVSFPEPLECFMNISAPLLEAKTYGSVADHYDAFAPFLLC